MKRLDALPDPSNKSNYDWEKWAIQKAYEVLWEANGGDQYRDLQIRLFQVVTAAFRSLTPLAVLEAICLDPDEPDQSETLELDQIEPLYSGFLKVDSEGYLEYEHLSAKMFVNGIEECSIQKSHRMMADIGIAAIKRPSLRIWIDADIELVDWGAQMHQNIIQNLSKSWDAEIRLSFKGDYFGGYLFRFWLQHCQTQSARASFVQKMSDLFQGAHSGLEGWVLSHSRNSTYKSRLPYDLFELFRATLTRQPDQIEDTLRPNAFLCMVSFGFSPFSHITGNGRALLPGFENAMPRNFEENTALHIAWSVGNEAIVEDILLWERQTQGSCLALLTSEDRFGCIPLHYAETENVVEVLLHIERLDLPVPAAESGRLKSRMLSWQNKRKQTPIMSSWAANRDQVYVMRILEQYEVGPLEQMLCQAVASRSVEVLELLLKQGANPNARGVIGSERALYRAVRDNSRVKAALLLDYGATFEPADDEDKKELRQILFPAASGDMVDLLFSKGVGIDLVLFGIEALGDATDYGEIEKAQVLLDNGVDINARHEGYETPLENAVFRGGIKMAAFLLENGADVGLLSKKAKRRLNRLLAHPDEEYESWENFSEEDDSEENDNEEDASEESG